MQYKMIIHVTKVFDTVTEADEFYEEIAGELRKHEDLHVNGLIVTRCTGYSPENPQGHEVPV